MRSHLIVVASSVLAMFMSSTAFAQPGGQPGNPDRRGPQANGNIVESSVNRLMALDENKDGQLSKSEVSDGRLAALFARADANRDGMVSREELTATFTRDAETVGGPGPGGPGGGPGGPGGGPGGPSGFGPGPGGPGGFGRGPGGGGQAFGPGQGGRPRPGLVLPPFVQEMLQLSEKQREAVNALQKDVDERLAKILTEEQRQQLAEAGRRGPGGPPGEGGFGPPGNPEGRPKPPRDPR